MPLDYGSIFLLNWKYVTAKYKTYIPRKLTNEIPKYNIHPVWIPVYITNCRPTYNINTALIITERITGHK